MGPATRQDVQNIMNVASNRIMERTVTKQDISMLMDMLRQLVGMHQQSQQILKQSEYQRLQLTRRAAALEARLATVESEFRNMAAAMNRMAGTKQQPIILPAPAQVTAQPEQSPGMLRQYGYEGTQ